MASPCSDAVLFRHEIKVGVEACGPAIDRNEWIILSVNSNHVDWVLRCTQVGSNKQRRRQAHVSLEKLGPSRQHVGNEQ